MIARLRKLLRGRPGSPAAGGNTKMLGGGVRAGGAVLAGGSGRFESGTGASPWFGDSPGAPGALDGSTGTSTPGAMGTVSRGSGAAVSGNANAGVDRLEAISAIRATDGLIVSVT